MISLRKLITLLAVLIIIGGGALYWSKTHKVDYVVEASGAVAESGDQMTQEPEGVNSVSYSLSQKESLETTKQADAYSETSSDEIVQLAAVGAVDLAVQFYNAEKPVEDYWVFQVAMDTHSVDLDQIDLVKSVYFIDGNGKTIKTGFKVKKSGAGHHVSQYIELPKQLNGEETIRKDDTGFKMVFMNIDGVEKTTLEWDMTTFSKVF